LFSALARGGQASCCVFGHWLIVIYNIDKLQLLGVSLVHPLLWRPPMIVNIYHFLLLKKTQSDVILTLLLKK